MHLLAAQPGDFVDDSSVITRMAQDPADIIILSAADTTLALLAAACPAAGVDADGFPSVRLANLMYLRQPAAVDLYVDEVLQHARVIIIDTSAARVTGPTVPNASASCAARAALPSSCFPATPLKTAIC